MTLVVFYVSGHGFGHAARLTEVVRALARRVPDLVPLFRTPVDRDFLSFNYAGKFEHSSCRLDVGVVQSDSLSVDPEASLGAFRELASNAERLIAEQVASLGPRRPELVVADIPAFAFDIAARLGVPGVALANFSWDWIYADYVRDRPADSPLVDVLRRSYGHASLLLRLPMHGDLSAFPLARDIPLVARRATLSLPTVRRRLGLAADRRVVLLSFGGLGLSLPTVPHLNGVDFVSTQEAGACRVVSVGEMRAAGVRYEDLVAASDAVMTKPGYGIVAECIANGTPIVYTSRGRFAEYDCLVEGIRAHLPNVFIGNEALREGRWGEALDEVLSNQRRGPTFRIDGAEIAADILAGFLE